jgi:hypothetical protein
MQPSIKAIRDVNKTSFRFYTYKSGPGITSGAGFKELPRKDPFIPVFFQVEKKDMFISRIETTWLLMQL